ncbi:hypothetical protein CRM79_05260 [Pantoea agglomerans]|nr:hypothetical protein [Pantoea agglomerans]PEI02673.1 hypothetical protein CRM79_05260 [Pantoea agglomerans]
MKPLSERIKYFPANQFVDWLCLSCVDVREVSSEEDAQDEINKIRKAVTERIAELEQQRDALAAENAVMLKLLTDISEQYQEVQTESEENAAVIDLDYISDVNTYVSRDVGGENPFTATDAYLNTVRAEGADSVGVLIRTCAHEFPDSVEDIVEECAMIADNRAISLRAGKDGE